MCLGAMHGCGKVVELAWVMRKFDLFLVLRVTLSALSPPCAPMSCKDISFKTSFNLYSNKKNGIP